MRLELPEFSRQKAPERAMLSDAVESGFAESGCMVGEASRPQAGDDAEGKIQRAHKHERRKTHHSGRNAEIGDEPERPWPQCGSDAGDEAFEFALG